jgi:hypothetical protein
MISSVDVGSHAGAVMILACLRYSGFICLGCLSEEQSWCKVCRKLVLHTVIGIKSLPVSWYLPILPNKNKIQIVYICIPTLKFSLTHLPVLRIADESYCHLVYCKTRKSNNRSVPTFPGLSTMYIHVF